MSTQTQARRLNPFIFPTNTDLQFVLLIALLIAVGAVAYYWIALFLPGFSQTYFGILQNCIEIHRGTVETMGQNLSDSFRMLSRGDIDSATSTATRNEAGMQSLRACLYPAQVGLFVRILAGLGVLFGGGALLYGLMPTWIDRRNKVQPLTRDDAPEAIDALEAMAREVGLRAPRWVWTPLDMRSAAQAYGGWGGKTVWLSGGLVSQHYAAPERFRAVALHELAHIKNGDVGKTYFATMLFVAYVALTLLPQVLTLVIFSSERSVADWLAELWQALALGAVVLAVRNAILREREYYADVRASAQPGTREGLDAMLADEARDERRAALRSYATHPLARQRQNILASTAQLFKPSSAALFITGLLFGLVSQQSTLLLGAAPDITSTVILIFAPLFAALAIGAVGLSHWRAMFAHMVGAGPTPRLRTPLLRFMGGYLLAQVVLTPTSLFADTQGVFDVALIVLAHLAWAGWLALALALITTWAVALAQLWLLGDDAARPSRLRYAVWVLAAWAVTALLTQPVMRAYGSAVQAPLMSMSYALLMPFLVVSTTANAFGWLLLWILPLAAHYARGRLTRTPEWAFLEAPETLVGVEAWPSVGQPGLQPRLAMLSGLFAGTLAMALVGLGRYLYTTIDVDGPGGEARVQQMGALLVGCQITLMVAAGAAAVVRVRSFRITHGLLAASIVAICVGLVTYLARVGRPLSDISALDEALVHTRLLLSFGMPLAVAVCWVTARLQQR